MNIQPDEIKIGCPRCGQHLVLDSSMLGMELECPICRQTFLAAGPEASVAPPPSRKRIMIKHRAPNSASCGGVEMRGSGKGKPKRSRGRAVVVGLVFIIAAVLLARSELFKLISKATWIGKCLNLLNPLISPFDRVPALQETPFFQRTQDSCLFCFQQSCLTA